MTTAIAEAPKKTLAPPPIAADAGSPTVNIAVSRIVPSPWNRKAEVTDDLVESVRQYGVLQNVILRPHKATAEDVALYSMKDDPFLVGESIYQLVAGERRWGAAKKAGKAYVIAAVRHLSDIEAMDLQIDENENRKNLRPMERAEAYDRLRMLYQEAHAKDKDYTEEKAIAAVAASRKCSARTVYDVISLKKLTLNAQHALRNGEMETSHGVAMSGRSPEEQEKLLLWIRQQTHHSQGDVPSVRRLKLEIRQLDIDAEDKKRQEKLFKESQPGTWTAKDSAVSKVVDELYPEAVRVVHAVGQEVHKVSTQLLQRRLHIDSRPAEELLARMEREGIVRPEAGGFRLYIWPAEQKKGKEDAGFVAGAAKVSFDGKTIDLIPGKLPGSVQVALVKAYSRGPHAPLTTAHFLKDGRVQLAIGLTGKPFYLTVPELQNVLTTGIPHAVPADEKKEPGKKKPPTKAELEAAEKQREKEAKAADKLREDLRKQKEKQAKDEENRKISVEIEQQTRTTTLELIAKKVKLDRTLINDVLMELLAVGEDAPAQFAVRYFGWPKARSGHFSYNEILAVAKKQLPKMKPNQVAALLVACLVQDELQPYYANDKHFEKLDAMARRYKVNMAKIRKDLTAKSKQKPAAKKKGAAA